MELSIKNEPSWKKLSYQHCFTWCSNHHHRLNLNWTRSRSSLWPLRPNCYTLKMQRFFKNDFIHAFQSEYSRVDHCGIFGSQIGISFPQPGIPGTKKSQSSFGCFTSFFPFTLVIIEIYLIKVQVNAERLNLWHMNYWQLNYNWTSGWLNLNSDVKKKSFFQEFCCERFSCIGV